MIELLSCACHYCWVIPSIFQLLFRCIVHNHNGPLDLWPPFKLQCALHPFPSSCKTFCSAQHAYWNVNTRQFFAQWNANIVYRRLSCFIGIVSSIFWDSIDCTRMCSAANNQHPVEREQPYQWMICCLLDNFAVHFRSTQGFPYSITHTRAYVWHCIYKHFEKSKLYTENIVVQLYLAFFQAFHVMYNSPKVFRTISIRFKFSFYFMLTFQTRRLAARLTRPIVSEYFFTTHSIQVTRQCPNNPTNTVVRSAQHRNAPHSGNVYVFHTIQISISYSSVSIAFVYLLCSLHLRSASSANISPSWLGKLIASIRSTIEQFK